MADVHANRSTQPNLNYMSTELLAWDLQRLVDDGHDADVVPNYLITALTPVGNEQAVRDCIARNVYDLVERLPLGVTLGAAGVGRGFHDLEFKSRNSERRLPVEVKSDWILENLGDQSVEHFFNSNQARNNSPLCVAFCQLNQYLVMNDVCYGLLFTYNRAWFVHVVSHNVLEVAPVVLSDSGTMLAYIESFLMVALANLVEEYPRPPPDPVNIDVQARDERAE